MPSKHESELSAALAKAIALVTEALNLLDSASAPPHLAAHLDRALAELHGAAADS